MEGPSGLMLGTHSGIAPVHSGVVAITSALPNISERLEHGCAADICFPVEGTRKGSVLRILSAPHWLLAMRRDPMGLEVPAGGAGHSRPKRRIGAFPRLVTQAPMETEHQSFVVQENTGRHVGTSKVKQEPPQGLPLGRCGRLLKRSDQTPYDNLSICRGHCKGPCCTLPVNKLGARSRSLHNLRNELKVQARVRRRPVQRQRQQLAMEASLDVGTSHCSRT